MFIHNIDPILVTIGPIAIRYYGLIYALGFLVSYLFLRKEKKFLKLNEEQIDSLFLYIMIGTVIGARVLDFVFYNPSIMFTDPIEILKVWHGGLSFHGGLIGLVVALFLYSKKHKIAIYKITDTLVIPASFVLFLGRIANFINGELFGTISNLSWAVNFHGEKGITGNLIYRHPSQIYESLKNFFNFAVLFIIRNHENKNHSYKPGFRTWSFIFLYGILRAFTNIWREDIRTVFGILSTGQFLSLIMAIIAVYFLYSKYFSKKK